eukprot:TRINITY_DN2014_c0_g1_i2.p1 TRINITY_DN2014_c0_g1~~TRINITY_DN2014_c0_g1_i2.p1  ORF type:complete len:323 (+),score=78.03 TRINITY_DN2014_c0_g1_i2:102-1070(+)
MSNNGLGQSGTGRMAGQGTRTLYYRPPGLVPNMLVGAVQHLSAHSMWKEAVMEPANIFLSLSKRYGYSYPHCAVCGNHCAFEGHVHSANHFRKLWSVLDPWGSFSVDSVRESAWQSVALPGGEELLFNHMTLEVEHRGAAPGGEDPAFAVAAPAPQAMPRAPMTMQPHHQQQALPPMHMYAQHQSFSQPSFAQTQAPPALPPLPPPLEPYPATAVASRAMDAPMGEAAMMRAAAMHRQQQQEAQWAAAAQMPPPVQRQDQATQTQPERPPVYKYVERTEEIVYKCDMKDVKSEEELEALREELRAIAYEHIAKGKTLMWIAK